MKVAPRKSLSCRMGARIRIARGARGLTQEQLSTQMGFNDRQTLSAIESGVRKVSAEELTLFMTALDRDLEFFIDPFRLEGEGRFSFRARGADEDELEAFETKAGQWIAFWREQGWNQKIEPNPLRSQLTLTETSTFEDAQQAGEELAKNWSLGDVPAARLISTIEKEIEVLVLLMDMPKGLSGAACQVPGADSILINRKDSEGRRYFDLAHELFHVLTWSVLPPQRVDREKPPGSKAKKVEQLADNFAGALLMPRQIVEPLWNARSETGLDVKEWSIAVAAKLHVSTWALGLRLKNLGLINDEEVLRRDEENNGGEIPPLFSRRFMERAGLALDQGDVSVMRLVKLLETTGRGGLKELFKSHGLPVPMGI